MLYNLFLDERADGQTRIRGTLSQSGSPKREISTVTEIKKANNTFMKNVLQTIDS